MAGNVKMVDVIDKHLSKREAIATSEILLGEDVVSLIKAHKIPKGDVLTVAKIAGIQAAKKTSELIPMCHPIKLSHIEIDFKILSDKLIVQSKVKALDVTGVEMEAMVACAAASLTIYDMCKMLKRDIIIAHIRLIKKSGGRSGTWTPLETVE